ncbi:DUF6261 family protein [Ancylomarina longa]|uniref:Uncharacterized protein n=1 Tax=Ancylomarina longa TaxID=2487017 RepID=A0A434AXP7_9BACT|nr:DUF6261 family protein [Ancylomarina longa]RUT79190.1 hypothetical protein DLK05_05075 [Ancylomarina longa]
MKKVAYYVFSHKALYTFIGGVIALVEKVNTEELGLSVFVEKTKTEFEKFANAINREYTNPFTQLLIEADQHRDDRFIGLKSYIGACKYRKEEAYPGASEELERLIARVGTDLYKMPFAEESAALDTLIDELQSEQYAKAIRTIRAKEWIDQLVESQEVYKNLIQQRIELPNTNTDTIGDTRKPLIRANRSLLLMISLQEQASENPAITELIDQLNNHISKSMSSARLSNSSKNKEEETETAQQ